MRRLAGDREARAGRPSVPDAERHAEGERRTLDAGQRLDALDGLLQEGDARLRRVAALDQADLRDHRPRRVEAGAGRPRQRQVADEEQRRHHEAHR